MTDPDLVYRAEQAYLGAILARRGRAGTDDSGQPTGVTAEDFADPVHQAVFVALTEQADGIRAGSPIGWLARLRDLLERLLSRESRDAAAYMSRLPGLCPNPASLAAYAAMISEAGQERADQARARQPEQSASEDPTLAGAGAWLDSTRTAAQPVGRRRVAPAHPEEADSGPARSVPTTVPANSTAAALAPDVARLARTLRASAQRAGRLDLNRQDQAGRPADRSTSPDLVTTGGRQAVLGTRDDLERRVLASLMRHPEKEQAIAKWLPVQAFSSTLHRDLYDLVRQRLASGRPVDPLIIAWDASRLPDSSFSGDHGGSAALAQVALQVGALASVPGSAELLGRTLWADRLLTSTLGKDWPAEPAHVSRLLAALEPNDRVQQHWSASVGPSTNGPEREPEASPTAATTKRAMDMQPIGSQPPNQAQPAARVPLQQPAAPAVASPVMRM